MEELLESQAGALYPSRPSEFALFYVDQLSKPPEQPLSPEQEDPVYEFEADLIKGRFKGPTDEKRRVGGVEGSLAETETRTHYSDTRCEITLDYFSTEQGKAELTSIGIKVGEDDDPARLAHLIRKHALDVPAGALKKLQKSSDEYAQDLIAKALVTGEKIEPPKRIVVFSNVHPLLRRADGLHKYNKFYRDVSRSLVDEAEEDDNNIEVMAKQAVLKIYRKKVNALVSEFLPDLIYMREQIDQMDIMRSHILRQGLEVVWPTIKYLNIGDGSDTLSRLAVRMDRLRNGASEKDGRLTAISAELENIFEQETAAETKETADPLFNPEEIDKLTQISFDATQMQSFCEDILRHFDALSDQPPDDYNPDRPTRAKDGKWQVPIREIITAMGVDDPPGAWTIPEGFDRNITEVDPPVGVVSGAAHENKHRVQADNIRNNPKNFQLAIELGGKGRTVMKEAGAILTEREVQRRLFGRTRSDNPHYLRALKVVEAGGNEVEATKAFYDSYRRANPNISPTKAADTAVSRAKRLVRLRGGFNSQPLNYAETALLVEAVEQLPAETKDIIFAEAAYNLEDMAALHRFGLWNSSPEPFPMDEFTQLVADKLRALLV